MILGTGGLFIGGGVIGAAASFTENSSASADFRVVSHSSLELVPANDPPIHVQTDSQSRVTAIAPGGDGEGLTQKAITRFEDIVLISNVSSRRIDSIYFSFNATSSTLTNQELTEIENSLQVTAADKTLESGGVDNGDNLLAKSDHGNAVDGLLSPGEAIPFGLQVNLISSIGPSSIELYPSQTDFDITLSVSLE
ncbi:hypothetical protein CP556_14920 [Natrinema sp. CBA1119]|uniref:hypothetical protein n=1 Tax=Natrinema sp. CBA1119 TaxID=1608465 RepID=UPI000BF46EEC|nr:hypothetical protein [Natrinema sp. CBA1119]PGF17261.1 hypothetical protein CP556_14920 [Natrinema sp. CBA1119]